MTVLHRVIFAIALGTGLPTAAQDSGDAEQTRFDDAGHIYGLACNDNGFVLNSLYPIARIVGEGADRELRQETETIYLGASCDAVHQVFGEGSWCWANGGVAIDLGERQIGLPRQELHCGTSTSVGRECGC